MKGGRNLSLDLTINRKTQTFAADLYLQGKKGSQLEANLATLGKTHSVLGHLALQDSAFAPSSTCVFRRNYSRLLPELVKEATGRTLAEVKNPRERQDHERFFQTLGEVFASGEIDAAFVLRSLGKNRAGSVVAGIKVPNGMALDELFREAVAKLDDKAFRDLFELGAEDIGKVKVHRVRVQQHFGKQAGQVFGDNPFRYAFRSDAFVYSAGADGPQALAQGSFQMKPADSPLALLAGNVLQFNDLSPVRLTDVELGREHLTRGASRPLSL